MNEQKQNTLKDSTSLTTLKLTLEDMEHLAEMIKDSTPITSLDLRGNNISPEGIKYLAEMIKDKSTITITLEDMEHLAEMVNNTSITSLDLRGNNIGSEGMDLAKMVTKEMEHLVSSYSRIMPQLGNDASISNDNSSDVDSEETKSVEQNSETATNANVNQDHTQPATDSYEERDESISTLKC